MPRFTPWVEAYTEDPQGGEKSGSSWGGVLGSIGGIIAGGLIGGPIGAGIGLGLGGSIGSAAGGEIGKSFNPEPERVPPQKADQGYETEDNEWAQFLRDSMNSSKSLFEGMFAEDDAGELMGSLLFDEKDVGELSRYESIPYMGSYYPKMPDYMPKSVSSIAFDTAMQGKQTDPYAVGMGDLYSPPGLDQGWWR